ncbi:MAG: carbohydrate-binding domain-containing protein [Paludibacteraceae bacterium]|nr:carbohydrate-binding domain-containing protein [Paludibacteraceae bacterium]
MKKGLLLTAAVVSAALSFADYRAVFFKNNTPLSQTKVSNIKSITAADKKLNQTTDDSNKSFDLAGVDSLVFYSDTVYVHFSDNGVAVRNPLSGLGLLVQAQGTNVTVYTDTTVFDLKDVVFALSGTASNGSFYMEQQKRTTLLLDNLALHSDSKAAIAMSGSKGVSMVLKGTNSISDSKYHQAADVPNGDTTNAAIYVNDNLDISGDGSLTVQGSHKHGFYVKDDLSFSGNAVVSSSAEKAAFRVKDNFSLSGGSVVALSALGSAIDVNDSVFVKGGALTAKVAADDEKAVTCDGGYYQSAGSVEVEVAADGAKGIKAGSLELDDLSEVPSGIVISGGILNVKIGAVTKFTDDSGEESSPAGLKADGTIKISGSAQVTVSAPEGSAGVKGVSADGDITVGGNSKVNVSVLSSTGKAWCYKTDGAIYVNKACVTTVCNEDNPKYDSDKAGLYNCAAFKYIDY